ncbi:MAG: PLP-dependent lyase/thiolase [Patescibacteria group bacterium]|nr:PLP-dependent lyase/thiolase [Patescibacteria group bacterium]
MKPTAAKGETPTEQYPALAKAIGIKELYLKREDLHPYGSHKGRSIPVMIDRYSASGERHFAISSSGNAALAAALYVHELNAGKDKNDPLDLDIFVGQHASSHKVEKLYKLVDKHVQVTVKERPLMALAEAGREGFRSLRQSMDDTALLGYKSLAKEMTRGLVPDKNAAIFVATSSGTTAQALAEYFSEHSLPIQVHIVQTSSCHPMSDAFQTYDGPEERSDADAIVDKIANRKDALVPLIEETGGRGWIASNDDIGKARDAISKCAGFGLSANGALSFAGAMKAASSGFKLPDTIVCLIGGE